APASHELCFALVVRHARQLIRGFKPVAVRFTHRAPVAELARYRAFFDADVSFGAAWTELVFDRTALDARLPSADSNLLAILLPTAEEKRRAQRAPDPP